jgi:hypothetical protein
MTPKFKYFGLSILAFSLSLSFAALAQTTTGALVNPLPQPTTMGAPPTAPLVGGDNAGWNNENINRKDLREEMQQLRKQHEDLEAAVAQFRTQCGVTPGAPPSPGSLSPACEQQKEALRAQHQALHAQRLALREKMQTMPGAHPGQPGATGMTNMGMPSNGQPPMGTAPNGQPPSRGPSFAPAPAN